MQFKVAASFNTVYEQDAFIAQHLPAEGRSEEIKAALELYYRVKTGDVQIIGAQPVATPTTPPPDISLMVDALLNSMTLLLQETSAQRREAQHNAQALIGAIQSIRVVSPTHAPENGKNALVDGVAMSEQMLDDEGLEDPNDPLVKALAGASESFLTAFDNA